jgi:hypothetical protein
MAEVPTLLLSDGVLAIACEPTLTKTISSSEDRRWTFGLM